MEASDVEQLEETLQQAMLAGNVSALEDLISDRLVFVTLDGTNIGKEDDLFNHRSGRLRLSNFAPDGPRHIELCGEVALVNVAMQVAGNFTGASFSGLFRYTRVWRQEDGRMRVIAGQVCAIQSIPA